MRSSDTGPVHTAQGPLLRWTDELMTVLPAVRSTERALRTRVRRWLAECGWPDDDADDIQLAVAEAVANAVDHAYPEAAPGPVSMHAWTVADRVAGTCHVVVTIIDRGRWLARPGGGTATRGRGRGLRLMSACTATLHLQTSAAGTTVILSSVPVPLGRADGVTAAWRFSSWDV